MTTSLFKNHRDIRRDSMIDEFKTIKSKKLYNKSYIYIFLISG
jgi:hypothetical protein